MAEKVTVAELLAAMSIQNQRIEALQQMLVAQQVKGQAAKPAKAEMPISAEPIAKTAVRVLNAAEAKALGLPEGTPILPLCRYDAPCRRAKYNGGFFADYGSVTLPYGSELSVNEIRSEGGYVLRFTK